MIQVVRIMRQTGNTVFSAFLLACFLFAAGNVSAEKVASLEDGQVAFNAGDYTLAFSLWSTLATQGDTEAQVFVGLAYDNGWGTPRSAPLARVWYQKAARNDNSSAQYLLGLQFIQGTNAERAKGLMWLQRAADNGDRAAQQFIQKGKKRGWFKGIPALEAVPAAAKPLPQTVALVQPASLSQ